TPMMLPMMSAIATGRPKPPPAAAPAPSPPGWGGATGASGARGATGASGRSRGVSVMAHSLLYERRFFPLISSRENVSQETSNPASGDDIESTTNSALGQGNVKVNIYQTTSPS